MIHLSIITKQPITNMQLTFRNAVLLLSLLLCITPAQALSLKNEIAENGFTEKELRRIFSRARVRNSVLEAMQNPAEYKFTWGKYRKLFLQEERIAQGVEFWQQHRDVLDRAEHQYGVPASVIVAIIGVESKFGRYKGNHKVLDSLVTLVTGYPRRSDFFAGELREFLILSKENEFDSTKILGSYAGAVGFPQFISSSYRHYAIDFSGDGKTDLIDQPVDAIGSVANYLVKNGWLPGQPVTSPPISDIPYAISDKANRKRAVRYSAASLRALGAPLTADIPDAEQLNVLMLDSSENYHEPVKEGSYIVRAGDTACEIAERFSMRCAELFALNKLDKRGTIYRGQRLKLANKANLADTGNKPAEWSHSESPEQASVMDNQSPNQTEQYFFTHQNFYVITRYNQSVLYAMAVHDLSQALQQAMENSDVL